MAKPNISQPEENTNTGMSALDQFEDADVRHQLFDIRALGASVYALLHGGTTGTIDQDDAATIERLVRMVIEHTDGAIEHINQAEGRAMKEARTATA